jgi:hypothetical protein
MVVSMVPQSATETDDASSSQAFDWEAELKGLLKAELARKNLKYPDLVRRLARVGVKETVENLRNKVSRGNFSAIFLLQCLTALGVRHVALKRYPHQLGGDPDERGEETWDGDEYRDT